MDTDISTSEGETAIASPHGSLGKFKIADINFESVVKKLQEKNHYNIRKSTIGFNNKIRLQKLGRWIELK